ncbi:hypothetical protein DID74_02265 [Candidatus Marinamargulisbacteria bacterium SCGC AG-333-B06]|nr:hypothetical protein DID74_02265 [Candidatus Marinamargulisbacteria bacterium SCGC AG-333-B06]
MKHIIIILGCLYIVTGSVAIGVQKTITNPQAMMAGARSISLGLNPIIMGDIGHTIINPATNADIKQLPFSITQQKIYNNFNYLVVSTGIPSVLKFERKGEAYRQQLGISMSYGDISLSEIPETINQDGLPYQIGSFSAGYRLAHIGVGTNFYDKLTFNKISIGSALKTLTYYVGSDSATTIGADIGVIAMRYIDYKFITSLEVGGVIHNAISPGMTIEETQNKIVLPFAMILGSKVNLFNDRLSILSSYNELGISLGAEFEIEDGVYLRSSTSTDQKDIRLGLGIILDNIPTGILNYGFKGRFDFNYTQAAFPMNDDPSYVFSIGSLGRSIPKKPEILNPRKPVNLISEKTIGLSGVGPKSTTIRMYNNGEFQKSFLTNKFGNWEIETVYLEEGENELYIKSYDMSKDLSLESNYVTIISDTISPSLNIKIFPDNSILKVVIDSNERLANISAEIDGRKIRLKEEESKIDDDTIIKKDTNMIENIYLKQTQYIGRAEFPSLLGHSDTVKKKGSYQEKAPPQTMSEIEVFATDESGNSIEVGPILFFGSITYPVDKHVHYNDRLLVIGNSSDLVEDIYINREKALIDPENRFASSVELNAGKNIIEFTFETQEQKTLTFYTRVLRLVSYPDINSKIKGRREIEFLSTLKILHGDNDGRFYPRQNVTRQFITKLMVLSVQEEEEIEDATYNLFSDVAFDHPFAKYIQAGVNNGLIFAFPDGSFKPDQELTLTEIIYLMSNAGIINYEEVEDSDRLITRAELAEFLAYTPKFERKIEKLIDWEKGYDISQ